MFLTKSKNRTNKQVLKNKIKKNPKTQAKTHKK